MQSMGVAPKAAVFSGGRIRRYLGRCARVDRSLTEGEEIAAPAKVAGVDALHKGILIESCRC